MSLSTRICKNGSVMPPMSYSGAYELLDTSLSIRTSPSRQFCNKKALSEHLLTQMKMQVHNDLDGIIQQQCQKKNQLSGRKEEILHFWCRSQQRERLRTQKKVTLLYQCL